jgi:hypothetical protein
MANVVARLFVDIHPSKVKLPVVYDGNYFSITSMVSAYCHCQMWLMVVVEGNTRLLPNASI